VSRIFLDLQLWIDGITILICMHPNTPHFVRAISAKTIMVVVLMVFIALSFFLGGFLAGTKYPSQNLQNISPTTTPAAVSGIPQVTTFPSPLPLPTLSPTVDTSCQQDGDCTFYNSAQTNRMQVCCNISCTNYFDASVIAVNVNWLAAYKGSICVRPLMCPMIAMMCTKEAMQSHDQVKAKCQNNICTKVTM